MEEKKIPGLPELMGGALIQTQEMLAPLKISSQQLSIVVPKEITLQEKRVGLTPSSVQLLVNNGHHVFVETKAGSEANFSDREYSEAGARIIYNAKELYQSGNIVIKVDPPTPDELEFMKSEQLLISAIQLANLNENYLKLMLKKRINAVAFEFYRDASGSIPIIRSMSEIAGSTSLLIAAEYLASTNGGKGEMLGGIAGVPPTEVVIIGAGTVGEFAVRAALGLGASVKVFDNSLYKLRRLCNNIGKQVFTSIIQPNILLKALKNCDVAVGAMRGEGGMSPCIVTENMVMQMKPGTIVVDVSIDRGGCFETSEVTTHNDPVFRKHDVIHYCVPNISSRVARTGSYALSNVLTPLLLQIGEAGGFHKLIWERQSMRSGVYIFKGNLTSRQLGNRFNMSSKSLDLLIGGHI